MLDIINNYYSLCKPKVVALMLVTSIIGMALATPSLPDLQFIFIANLGIALCASSAAVINQILEVKLDKKMGRTNKRPLANNKIAKSNAIIFAVILASTGLSLLYLKVNLLTAQLTALTVIGYALFYTTYLKKATPQNIVIGGAAGAAPPLLGWAAVTNTVDPHALLLVLIIYTWTPPHFWALALAKKEEYREAGLPMLPVTHGDFFTKVSIILYTILTLVASILPYATGMSGIIYLAGALIIGLIFLLDTIRLFHQKDLNHGMQTFALSIIYLFALFTFLLIDHYI